MKPSQIIARAIANIDAVCPRSVAERKEVEQLIYDLETIMLEMQQKEMQASELKQLFDAYNDVVTCPDKHQNK